MSSYDVRRNARYVSARTRTMRFADLKSTFILQSTVVRDVFFFLAMV